MEENTRNSKVTNNDLEILQLMKNERNMDKGMKLLIHTHQKRLYYHIRRMVGSHEDTDDILQNVFIKAYRSISTFEGKSKLSTWLYRIATNESLTLINKRKRKLGGRGINEDEINNVVADTYVEGDHIKDVLTKAIALLPPKQKLVFNMRYFDELSYEEISKILSVSKGGLKASYHHAVKKIEAFVKENQMG